MGWLKNKRLWVVVAVVVLVPVAVVGLVAGLAAFHRQDRGGRVSLRESSRSPRKHDQDRRREDDVRHGYGRLP